MAREFEIVSHSQFRNLNVFLVRLVSRTTHIHKEYELGVVLDGSVELRLGSNSFHLEKDDIYLVNPLDAHEFLSSGRGALLLSIQISPKLFESFLSQAPGLRFGGSPKLRDHFSQRRGDFEILQALCVELAYEYFGLLQNHEYKCFSLIGQLFYQLKRDLPNLVVPQTDSLAARQKTDRIISITNYIEDHYTQKLLLEDIARREQLSMPYLSHLFKDTLGISFQEYLREKRFEHACNLIATTQRTILDISVSSGFSDVRYLTRLFQARFGCTPREYRSAAQRPAKKNTSPLESTQYFFTRQDSLLLLTPLRNEMLQKMNAQPLMKLW